MSWAQERVAQIKTVEEQARAARQNASAVREIVSVNGDSLWEMTATEIAKIAQELRDALPAAQAGDLRAERLSPNKVTVSTRVSPFVHLEITHHPSMGISGKMRWVNTSQEPWHEENMGMIRFCVDPKMCLWFTDGEDYLHPSQVAEELMEKVAAVYEAVATRPQFV
jgi:hypothetical protein